MPAGPLFLGFLTKSLSKRPSSLNLTSPLYPEKFLVEHLNSDIIPFTNYFVLNVWQCSEYVCLYNCSVICTVTLWYILHQTHSEFWHIQLSVFQVYAGIFKYIQHYEGIFTHIETLLRPIQTFLGILAPCVTLTYQQRCHILSFGILKTLWNVSQIYSEPCIGHYSAIFRHI